MENIYKKGEVGHEAHMVGNVASKRKCIEARYNIGSIV